MYGCYEIIRYFLTAGIIIVIVIISIFQFIQSTLRETSVKTKINIAMTQYLRNLLHCSFTFITVWQMRNNNAILVFFEAKTNIVLHRIILYNYSKTAEKSTDSCVFTLSPYIYKNSCKYTRIYFWVTRLVFVQKEQKQK